MHAYKHHTIRKYKARISSVYGSKNVESKNIPVYSYHIDEYQMRMYEKGRLHRKVYNKSTELFYLQYTLWKKKMTSIVKAISEPLFIR